MDDERMRGDVMEQHVTTRLGPNGVAAGDGGLPRASLAPNPHRHGGRSRLRQVRMRSGWGEFIAGLYGSAVFLRYLMQALEQHRPRWIIGLFGAIVLAGLAYAGYGVFKWWTARQLKEKRLDRHSLVAHD
jgi:hypothetical protein